MRVILKQQKTKIWNVYFISIFVASAGMYLGQWMINPILALYIKTDLHATPDIVGMIISSFAVTALIFKFFSGSAIDSFKKRLILTGALLVLAIAYFGYFISDNIQVVVVFRLIQGSAMAFSAICCLTLAADSLPGEKFGAGIGIYSLSQAFMQAIGPAIGLAIKDAFGFHTVFLTAMVIMLFAAFFAFQVKTPEEEKRPFKICLDAIFEKKVTLCAIIMFFLSSAFCIINSFLVIFAEEQGVTKGIGLYFTVYAATLLFTRPLIGKLSDKFGTVKVVIPAITMFAASFIIISFSNSLLLFLCAAFVAGFGYGACQPAVQALCMKCVSKDRRGVASSSNYIGMDLGNLAGPNISGVLIMLFGYVIMWRLMTLFIVAAGVLVVFSRNYIYKVENSFALAKNP
jgi:MFS family permease